MPGDGIISHWFNLIRHRRVLHGAHTQVAGGSTHDNRTGNNPVTLDLAARADNRQPARGWNPERVHGLGHKVFTQHRPERTAASGTRAGRWRAAKSFGVDTLAEYFAEPERAA